VFRIFVLGAETLISFTGKTTVSYQKKAFLSQDKIICNIIKRIFALCLRK